jgi:hypothetical protein
VPFDRSSLPLSKNPTIALIKRTVYPGEAFENTIVTSLLETVKS